MSEDGSSQNVGESSSVIIFDLSKTNEDLVRFERHPIIREALNQEVDLRDYSRDIDRTLTEHQFQSIKEYSKAVPKVVKLAEQIDKCDEVLQGMEEVLNSFRDRLERTTNQIRHLHIQSGTLKIKLQNRQNVEHQLREYLDKVTLSPRLIRVICDGKIDAEFSKCLAVLEQLAFRVRMAYDRRSETAPVSVRDVFPEVQRLSRKAVSRIREFMLFEIRSLRKPNTNVQMAQQNKLRVYGTQFLRFVHDESPSVYAEIERVYVATMATVFLMLFRTYHAGLLRMRVRVAGEEDVLARSTSSAGGNTITASGLITSLFSNAPVSDDVSSQADLAKLVSIASRLQILQHIHDPPIVVHGQNKRIPYESIFRSLQRHLVSLVLFEYHFLGSLFSCSKKDVETSSKDVETNSKDVETNSKKKEEEKEKRKDDDDGFEKIDRNSVMHTKLFQGIFERTLEETTQQVETCLLDHFDALGLLLMIRITLANIKYMKRKNVNVLDTYFMNVCKRLWRRFGIVMNRHCASLDRVWETSTTASNDVTTFSNVNSKHPQAHFTARRYGDLCSAVMRVGDDIDDVALDEVFDESVTKLTTSIQKMFKRLANRFRDSPRHQAVFFVNNYSQIIPFFRERVPLSSVLRDFERKCELSVEEFVKLELSEYFEDLVEFVKESQAKLESHEPFSPSSERIFRVLRDFSMSWKKSIRSMDSDIIKFFSDYKIGVEISQKVLTKLLLYYSRFLEVSEKIFPRLRSRLNSESVNVQVIVHEIKKYSRSFDDDDDVRGIGS